MLLLSGGIVVPTQADVIASYPCETDTNDPVGGHNGMPQGISFPLEPSLNRTVCNFNTPYSKDHYIQVPHSDDFNLNSGPFTLRACIYQTDRNPSYSGTIFGNRGTANGWFLGICGAADGDGAHTGKLKFRVNDNNETNVIRSWSSISLNAWHSVVLVYDGTTATMYIDGELRGSKTPFSSPGVRAVADAPLFIGKNSESYEGNDINDHPYWWFGKMFNLGIENTALNIAEIREFDATCRNPLVDLTVTSPTGGTVTGQDISCGTQCKTQLVQGTSVALTATPSAGYVLTGWGGACSGTAMTCTVSMTAAQNVTATFKPLYNLNVTKTGTGTVTSSPAGINCGSGCIKSYAADTKVTLTAAPGSGYTFGGWGGGTCSGTAITCTVSMTAAKNVTATFKPILTVNKVGSGTVSSTTAGINCGGDCTESYALNTVVTLTATSDDPNFTFAEWTGGCSGTAITCKVTMSQAKTVTARFISPNDEIKLDADGYACITGVGLGVHFSWLLQDSSGKTIASNLNAATFLGDTPIGIAIELGKDLKVQQGDMTSMPVVNECIELGNYVLFVGPPGATPQCKVTSAGCKFNPTIRWVSKTQMLTSIRGFIWNDLNNDGLQSLHETYLSEWTVVLKSSNGEETTTVSNADGYYEFTGLSAGDYTVAIETRTGATYTTSQLVTRKVDSVKIPRSANFGIGELGVKSSNDSIIISDNNASLVATPNAIPSAETEPQVVDNGNGTYTGTNGLVSVEVSTNGTDNSSANNELNIFTGSAISGTGEASSVKVVTHPDGSQSLTDDAFPGVMMTFYEDGTVTLTDIALPGMVFTLKSDGSLVMTDAAYPDTTVILSPEGIPTATDTANSNLTTTINPDGSITVTDIMAPEIEITFGSEGSLVVKDLTTGMTATSNSDGTYSVVNPEFPEIVVIVDPTNNTAQVINAVTKQCVTEEGETRRSTRGLFSSIKKAVNKATAFVNKVTGKVSQATQKVYKVAGIVNKGANFIIKYAPFVNKVASMVQTWALGKAMNAGPIGSCIFCTIAKVAGKIVNLTTPGSSMLGFVTKVANFSQKAMKVSSTILKVATTVSKGATTFNTIVNTVGKFFGFNMPHLRSNSVRASASPNCPIVSSDPSLYVLAVATVGSGTVTAQGIECGDDCIEEYAADTQVKLTPTAATGYRFKEWSGDCTNDTVTMDGIKQCIAHFERSLLSVGHVDGMRAVANGNTVTVIWQTPAEADSAKFCVWRANGIDANGQYQGVIRLGCEAAKGSISVGSTYTHEDKDLTSGIYFYAIEEIDVAGNSRFHIDQDEIATVVVQ